MKKRFTVTSALPYANGPLHIGHLAGAYLPADIFVRYQKNKGNDVAFICGSDEHGAAITLQAKKNKTTPKKIIDKFHNLNKKTFSDFGIDFDFFHRTSEESHHKTAQDFFLKLNENNAFKILTTKQYFDKQENQFLADRYIEGTCPKCGYEHAYGDQCENCGTALSPNELINPKSKISGNSPVLRDTTHWFLDMQKHEKWLKEWINKGVINEKKKHDSKDWKSQVISQCNSWIDNGLNERAMTRDLDWGVKLPIKNTDGKVLYVWLDAPIGYISSTKAWAKEKNKNWKDYWMNDETELIHFIGKDNIVFHCIIFPILLKIHGNYILPKNVPSNEFLNLEGRKISTSKNWAIWLHEFQKDFKNKQDSLRYYLCAISPEKKDSDFTWKDFQNRNNNELVDIYANFINRVIVLTNKYYDGITPKISDLHSIDKDILKEIEKSIELVGYYIEKFEFKKSLMSFMNIARIGNKYLTDTEPWKLIKTDETRVKTIMNISIKVVAALSIVSEPFLPFSSLQLKEIINMKNNCSWNFNISKIINEGHKIGIPKHLFSRINDEEIDRVIMKMEDEKK